MSRVLSGVSVFQLFVCCLSVSVCRFCMTVFVVMSAACVRSDTHHLPTCRIGAVGQRVYQTRASKQPANLHVRAFSFKKNTFLIFFLVWVWFWFWRQFSRCVAHQRRVRLGRLRRRVGHLRHGGHRARRRRHARTECRTRRCRCRSDGARASLLRHAQTRSDALRRAQTSFRRVALDCSKLLTLCACLCLSMIRCAHD